VNEHQPEGVDALDRASVGAEPGIYTAHGSTFAVHASEPLAHELESCLADLRAPTRMGDPSHVLTVRFARREWSVTWNGERRYHGSDADMALYDALIAINEHGAATAVAAGLTVLHGGAVGIDGSAVVFVGHSGAGKSTLTAAMTGAGFAYIADEVVAVRRSISEAEKGSGTSLLRVEPFHRPIGLRPEGAALLGVPVPDGPYGTIHPYRIGGRGLLDGPTPLRLILLLRRGDYDHATIEPVSPASALCVLANQTLGGVGLEREVFRRLTALVRSVAVAELRYCEVDDAIPVVEQTVSTLPTGLQSS
jgi:energy-coupling factor transporter ATP-binding protein EcfA2